MNQADANKNIENADAADGAAKRRMKKKKTQCLGQVDEKIVLLPEIGPGEIEKECAHLQAKDDQNDTKRLIHERKSENPREQGSASGFLKRGDAVGNIAIVDIGRIDLREALERPFNIPRRFLGNP